MFFNEDIHSVELDKRHPPFGAEEETPPGVSISSATPSSSETFVEHHIADSDEPTVTQPPDYLQQRERRMQFESSIVKCLKRFPTDLSLPTAPALLQLKSTEVQAYFEKYQHLDAQLKNELRTFSSSLQLPTFQNFYEDSSRIRESLKQMEHELKDKIFPYLTPRTYQEVFWTLKLFAFFAESLANARDLRNSYSSEK